MLYSFLAFLAAVGLSLSILCHLFSWLQVMPPGGKAAFLLHIGIFVVWLPLVCSANRTKPGRAKSNADHLLKLLPGWVRTGLSVIFVYALVNFVVFMVMAGQYPKHEVPGWLELRGFSGHWMMFYSVALAGFVGLRHLKKQNSLSAR
jgi:hypothetical protein